MTISTSQQPAPNTSPSTHQKTLKNISQPFGNPQAVTKNRKVTNLMKNEAAAEAPAETPAGATKLWEAAEPPGPVGSELFCPELTWTLGPSQTLSGAVSAWKRNKRKYKLILLLNFRPWQGTVTRSISKECEHEHEDELRSDTAGQAYYRRSSREGKSHVCSRQAEKHRDLLWWVMHS